MIQDANWAPGSREIERGEWASFLAEIARRHREWLVTVEVAMPAGRVVEVEERRLKKLALDSAGNEQRIYVQVENDGEEDLTYTVEDAMRLVLQGTGEGGGIEIVSADGRITALRFRQATGAALAGLAA